ncbi:MAG TPA: crosslink repair DNA glycosylase YcaQ family protein [Rhodanobacteraceae bacterium]|nr:crosslink repair DNA glycosylase YcaQ family protein [Rhodanobacteraceae bacterium]
MNPPFVELSLGQARLLHLAAQGLLHRPRRRPSRALLEQAIARMQMLQIDTIHVVARSPYLVLFSRVGDYPASWLDDLLADGRIAECWAHEACFVTAQDYPLHRAARSLRDNHWAMRRARRMQAEHAQSMQRLLDQVREHGPVRSSDFTRPQRAAGAWWDWKPEKRWLEAWFALGELMVAQRDRFQRVYDLAEKVTARHAAGPSPVDAADARRQMLARSVLALGVARTRWVGDYFRLGKATRDDMHDLHQSGEILPVRVHGWDKPAWIHRDHAELARRAAAGRLRATHTTLLSPFDPVIWDRTRVREMFDFDYTLECYLPAHRRRHGYFVLPLLHAGRLVGRLDAKAHRSEGVFEVRMIALESDAPSTEILVDALAAAIDRCAHWHRTPKTVVTSGPRNLVKPLRAALRALDRPIAARAKPSSSRPSL